MKFKKTKKQIKGIKIIKINILNFLLIDIFLIIQKIPVKPIKGDKTMQQAITISKKYPKLIVGSHGISTEPRVPKTHAAKGTKNIATNTINQIFCFFVIFFMF